jgi:riboflavin biosynthesis pyrimidine reductase
VIVTPVFPRAEGGIDIAAADARDRLIELYRPPREDWLRLNLVASVSGGATGSDGTSETLTNPADRLLLGVIRMLADVVLVGAASVRAEGYFVPRRAALAVVTRSGDLSGHRITSTGLRGALLILCPKSAAARVRETLGEGVGEIRVVPDSDGTLAAADIVSILRDSGYRSIVSEGGPILASHLLHGGVVDELCLSTSPVLNGAATPVFGSSEFAAHDLTLAGMMVDTASGVYARWHL